MDTHSKILNDFQNGQPASLYSHLFPALITFARSYLGSAFYMAEDLVQNAILSAWRQRTSLATYGSLKAYLYNSVRNQSISIYRKDCARNRYTDLQPNNEEEFTQSAIVEAETLSILHTAIKSLPERERLICEMSFFRGFRSSDIADLLSVSESTVKKQKAKALEMLRRKLDSYGEL